MFRRFAALAIGAGLLVCGAARAQEPKLPEEAQKAADAVKEYLQKLKGDYAQILYKDEAGLKKVFPDHQFIIARYRQFPVARALPEGLRASNVFAVTKKDQAVKLIQDVKGLEAFFKTNETAVKDEAGAKGSLAAWLALTQEFHQDGMFKFEVLEKDFGAESNEKTQTVRGRALVIQGGKGEVGATLVFEEGKLTKVTESGKVIPGPRPICQATKLLDRDPIVRKMAEQDLLFMGLAARDYIMEQRRRADPDLRAAIDSLWRRIEANGW
jgi:hypothetical protein